VQKRILSTILLWGAVIGSLWFFGPEAAVWLIAIISFGKPNSTW